MTTNTPVYALVAGTPYSLGTVEALATHLGSYKGSPMETAARYKALGFIVTGIPAADCATAVLVLYSGPKPPAAKNLV